MITAPEHLLDVRRTSLKSRSQNTSVVSSPRSCCSRSSVTHRTYTQPNS